MPATMHRQTVKNTVSSATTTHRLREPTYSAYAWRISSLFGLAVLTMVQGHSYDVCTAQVGSCVFSKSCPTGSQCIVSAELHVGVCYCDPGSCAVGQKCVRTSPQGDIDRQPLLTPEEWFLNKTEMSMSTDGETHRAGLNLWTEGNRVKYYAEAASFWLDFYNEVIHLPKGGRVWDTSWLVGPLYQLVPELDANHTGNTSFGQVLFDSAQTGAEVLVLAWRNLDGLGRYREVNNFLKKMRAAASTHTGSNRVEAHADGRINPTGSIHQKSVIISGGVNGTSVAYLGGIDFCESRFDVFGSNTSYPVAATEAGRAWQKRMTALRHADGAGSVVNFDIGGGFHDTELRLDGPAAYDVALNFAQRWNDQNCMLTDEFPVRQGPLKKIPLPTPAQFGSNMGPHAVQVVRTYGCAYAQSSGCYNSFAPKGEQSILQGLLKALRLAKHYIYIEDQYFFFVQELYDALRQALLHRVEHIFLCIQYPQEMPGFTTLLWKFWHPLYQEFPDRVHAYYRKGDVYIHAKTKIIDDVWFMTGSPNVNYRSTTFDQELAANVVDREHVVSADNHTVGRLARDWRAYLWEDATGIVSATWQKTRISDSVELWDQEAAKENGRVGKFHWEWGVVPNGTNIPEYALWADNAAFIDEADPDGRC